jgi:hypothetical protein
MNELVRPDRGLLVAATPSGQLNAAMRYQFDEASLEATVEYASTLDAARYTEIGARARTWFEANQRSFAGLLQDALQKLL